MKSSVQQFARELDRLCRNNIPMSQAFDMLENTAKSNMDLIVINVMRDSFNEVLLEEKISNALFLSKIFLYVK